MQLVIVSRISSIRNMNLLILNKPDIELRLSSVSRVLARRRKVELLTSYSVSIDIIISVQKAKQRITFQDGAARRR